MVPDEESLRAHLRDSHGIDVSKALGAKSRVPVSTCPNCKVQLDEASGMYGDYKPSPGIPTVCAFCGTVMIFDDTLHVRTPTGKELAELRKRPSWKMVELAVKTAKELQAERVAKKK